MLELLLALTVTGFVLMSSTFLFVVSTRLFRDTKSQSDNLENKSPSMELLSRYVDRWGVGVVSQAALSGCTGTMSDGLGNTLPVCPPQEKSLSITSNLIDGTSFSNVSFYGNMNGFGFVQSVVAGTTTTASLVSCRLAGTEAASWNCHNVWRSSGLLNDLSSARVVPLAFLGAMNSVDCLSATAPNKTGVNFAMSGSSGNRQLAAGDIIQRSPFHIRLFCQQNSNDSNRIWLYVKMTDTAAACNAGDSTAQPVMPVDAFNVQGIAAVNPASSSCTAASGGDDCGAMQITLTLRSETRSSRANQYDTIQLSGVYGR